MRTLVTKLLATATIVAIAATAASANTAYRDHFLTNWDENGDGKVTIEETIARRDAMFAAFDADSDGFLTPEELKMRDQMRAEQWKGLAEQGIQPGMHGQGMNGPGKGWGMQQGQGMRHGQGWGMQNGQGMRHGQGQGMAMRQGMGGQGMGGQGRGMDVDRDGRVSKAEFTGMSERWFARFDRNGDKAIDALDF